MITETEVREDLFLWLSKMTREERAYLQDRLSQGKVDGNYITCPSSGVSLIAYLADFRGQTYYFTQGTWPNYRETPLELYERDIKFGDKSRTNPRVKTLLKWFREFENQTLAEKHNKHIYAVHSDEVDDL